MADQALLTNVIIERFDPTSDTGPYFQEYEYELRENMTVLDVLNLIHESKDPTLSYSYSCRNRHCGLCGVTVNGKAVLSCKCPALPGMTVGPLKGFPVLKDLTADRGAYEKFRAGLRLQEERYEIPESEPEYIDPDAFEWFKQASRCIECYCCVSQCPVYAESPHKFLGPAGFVLESRHVFDPRDELDRLLILKDEGISRCIECGLCTDVCMMNTDPSGIISHLKNMLEHIQG